MAFATEKDKQEATAMLVDGIKPKAVAEKLGVKVDLVYGLNYELRKAGKIKPRRSADRKPAPAAPAKKSKNRQDDFDSILSDEFNRLTGEITRIEGLMKAYEGGNGDFIDALEKRLQKEKERHALIAELVGADSPKKINSKK